MEGRCIYLVSAVRVMSNQINLNDNHHMYSVISHWPYFMHVQILILFLLYYLHVTDLIQTKKPSIACPKFRNILVFYSPKF